MAFQLPGSPFPMRKTTKGSGRTFRTTEEGAGMTSKGVADSTKERTQVVN
jgi:hypothetical protein